MDAAQLGQVQQQIHQELTAVRELVSVQQQQLAVLLTDPTKEGESGGFEEGSTAQTADCLRRVLRALSFFLVFKGHHRPP